ncbi:MAG: M20/M25/M40 family metallo-hydrolase [Bacteroidales bacterium]
MKISIFWVFVLYMCSGIISAHAQQIKMPKQGKNLTSRQVVEYLASDALEGRYPGTKGDTLASLFIKGQFKKLGLESSLQPFGIKKDSCTTFNVIGILKGQEEKYIVVGAHYDHLGYGGANSGSRQPDTVAIHNGADDNASGIAAMLYLAKKYSFGEKPKKGIIFVAFGAEEKGVIGSKEFAANPLVERKKIVAMFNFDMVGYLRGGAISIGGTGTAKELDSLIDKALITYNNPDKLLKQTLAGTPIKLKKSKEGVGPSDHSAFYAKNIPVAYFSTGATLDYHTPGDDAYKLNYAGIDSVANFAGVLLNYIIEQPSLTFTECGSPNMGPMRASFKVTLGLMPDVTGQVENGLRADIVIKGKPAYNAGLKNGDIITSINELTVTDIESYMKCLATLKAGEIAKIKVKRGGEELLFNVQL